MVLLATFSSPTEGIKIQQLNTTVFCNEREMGKGILYISESNLSWLNDTSGEGFSIEYKNIAIHAISRDIEAHGYECIYLMIDNGSEVEDTEESQDEDNSDSGNENTKSGMIEMRLVPEDKGCLDAMFHAITECQALHPDPEDEIISDDDEIFEDADEEGEYHIGDGDAPYTEYGVERINGQSQDEAMETDGQFEDADFAPGE